MKWHLKIELKLIELTLMNKKLYKNEIKLNKNWIKIDRINLLMEIKLKLNFKIESN